MVFNQYTNQLMILDVGQKKVVCYDREGNYQTHFSTEFFAWSMENMGDSLMAFFSEQVYNLFVTDLSGSEVYHQFEADPAFQMGSSRSFVKNKDEVYFNRWLDDTLYLVTSAKAVPAFVADFGNRKLTRNEYRSIPASSMGDRLIPSGVMTSFHPMGVTDDYFLFYFGYKGGNIGIYNRKTEQLLVSSIDNILYDLTHGIYPLTPGGTYQDSLFIGCILPARLDKPEVFQFNDFELTVDPEDNPVVIIYRIKI